jgi:hypothetical protein
VKAVSEFNVRPSRRELAWPNRNSPSSGRSVAALRIPGDPTDVEGVLPVPADLLDPASLRVALGALRPSHVFLAAWLRQPTEAEKHRRERRDGA